MVLNLLQCQTTNSNNRASTFKPPTTGCWQVGVLYMNRTWYTFCPFVLYLIPAKTLRESAQNEASRKLGKTVYIIRNFFCDRASFNKKVFYCAKFSSYIESGDETQKTATSLSNLSGKIFGQF